MKPKISKPKTAPAKSAKAAASSSSSQAFAAGQKWQMDRGHAEIIQVGKTLIQYKFLKTGMIRGPIEMKSIPNFAEAMRANNAKLVA